MGVYIKGMEMPLPGTFNIIYIYSDGQVHMPSWGKGMTPTNGVKAIPIQPHGRLISADELIEFIENRYEITWKDDYEGGIKDACVDILEKISTMPTVIPASVEECNGTVY